MKSKILETTREKRCDGAHVKRLKLLGVTIYKRISGFHGSTQYLFGVRVKCRGNRDRKIDLVYSWVDGADKEWLKKKSDHSDQQLDQHIELTCEGRFANSDELLFSLRSIDKYARWINHIYIITDNQTPKWLNTNHPKITIVDHREIIDEQHLPTFNANVIEVAITNIEGLSEHYLFANDDMLFANRTSPEEFFTNGGKPIIRLQQLSVQHSRNFYCGTNPYEMMLEQSNAIIEADFGYNWRRYIAAHQIDAYSKSAVKECIAQYSDKISATMKNRFRQSGDIQRHLYSLYALSKDHGELRILENSKGRKNEHLYCDMSNPKLKKLIRRVRPMLLCVNDTERCNNADRIRYKEAMADIFPRKSNFEIRRQN
ncbi:MAG: stealth family protein [Rikenellaceae bacterium]